MEDWKLKNILDQSLYESEQRAKNNRIGDQINANKKVSAPMSLKGWGIAIIVFLIVSAIIPAAYSLFILLASFLGLL